MFTSPRASLPGVKKTEAQERARGAQSVTCKPGQELGLAVLQEPGMSSFPDQQLSLCFNTLIWFLSGLIFLSAQPETLRATSLYLVARPSPDPDCGWVTASSTG